MAKRRILIGKFTKAEWNLMKVIYGNRCCLCGSNEKPLTRDHIHPVNRGGLNEWANIQPLCRSCNSWKGAVRIIDYRPFSLPSFKAAQILVEQLS